ncbi:cobalamin biosynthesis protein [Picrophilus oshimae]|uniref:Probable cobalamin biosynthesis protein CobD n=1 Tax=Picrophilus torridus (strain ATCC 700027 / DSM 9790 / JCM 10055 / NBRC 100828 / KAW 2/3) TaxID=1122961 RepID=Q6L0V6_PICTO|nr:cobalamin biosynthesis protein [Picrophilus oshimae]AAT43396.1 cobalmin biosynthesis protein [Picrophilus oshimae DSM 9789]
MMLELIVLPAAYAYDVLRGEPYLHPVVFIGKTISFFKKYFYKDSIINGLFFELFIIIINLIPLIIILILLKDVLFLIYIIFSIYIAKSTFAVKSMNQHIKRIINSYKNNDPDAARHYLSYVVRRDTKIDDVLMFSAAIETIAEGFVDGFLSEIMIFPFLGMAGAYAFRIINTMDSNIAYKNDDYKNFGRAAAIFDTVINYIPARISPYLFYIAAIKYSNSGFKWPDNTTDSYNAGYPMSFMAHVLNVRLEKPGEYIINDGARNPSIGDVEIALKIYNKASFIAFLISFMISILLFYLNIYSVILI